MPRKKSVINRIELVKAEHELIASTLPLVEKPLDEKLSVLKSQSDCLRAELVDKKINPRKFDKLVAKLTKLVKINHNYQEGNAELQSKSLGATRVYFTPITTHFVSSKRFDKQPRGVLPRVVCLHENDAKPVDENYLTTIVPITALMKLHHELTGVLTNPKLVTPNSWAETSVNLAIARHFKISEVDYVKGLLSTMYD